MPTLTFASHATAAVAFGMLALLLFTVWRARMQGSLLLLAAVVNATWAAGVAVAPALPAGPGLLLLETARSAAWLLFLRRALAGTTSVLLPRVIRDLPLAVACGGMLVALAYALRDGVPLLGVSLPRFHIGIALALAIGGFVLVEQALRNTRESQAWSARYVWLACGALFAFDIALFSASYVLGGVETTMWAARGFADAAVTPVLAVGVSRMRGFRPQLLMSQKLAFYTSSIVASGLYLLFVATAGYYVRVLGGTWGAALEIALVFGALLGLVAALFSTAVRASLRVWLAKHLFPYKYDYRNEWLDLTDRLTRDPEGSSLPHRTLEAFTRLARYGGGGIWTARDEVLHPAAGAIIGPDSLSEPLSSEFCRFLARHEWVVDLENARSQEGRDGDAPVPAWLLRLADARLAIPLVHAGRLVGLVVLRAPLGGSTLTWEDLDLLKTAARQAASYLALEQAADALARERQFAAFNRFTAFLMHDLSNIVAQQRLIVDNAAKHKSNPAFVDDAIDTIENTVRRMDRLLEQMKTGATGGTPRRADLVSIARAAVERTCDREPRPHFETGIAELHAYVAADRLEHVVHHVVRNAQDATPPRGRVTVRVREDGASALIEVEDTGGGMDADFLRERLFRPFDTTKGAKGMGIGAFQTREFARAAGGDVEVSSVPGSGTRFVIRLPRS